MLNEYCYTLLINFPAFLTVRAAVDKDLVSVMRSCFATRFGPEPFAAMLSEMRYLDHAHRELLYTSALQSSPTKHPSPSGPETFSDFANKQRFAGTNASTHYWKGVFVDWMRAHRPFFDRIMASLTGKVLRGDHTFKVVNKTLSLYHN
jgi:hypothetical protein